MLKIEKKEASIPRIDYDAVEWYRAYFQNVLESYTFQLRLMNDQLYYVFSSVPQEEWELLVMEERSAVSATRYLDNIQMERLMVHNIKTIRDVTMEVRQQYSEQQRVIMESYELVSQIMLFKESKFIRDMVSVVQMSRDNDDSKRKYWRVLNEKYYGLDIHPLMEYELIELEKMLYFCQNPNELVRAKWVPVLKTGGIATGTLAIGYSAYLLMI